MIAARGYKLPCARAASPSSTVLTPDEVAERWRVDVKSIYQAIRDGELAAIRIGRVYRVPLSSVVSKEQSGAAPTEK